MDKAKRRTLRIGPLRPPPLLRDEHITPAECKADLAAMLKDAMDG